ncbi:TPR-like protein [Xylaria acuta]|nr:TPR-like protein [Xylaria acuta]
MLQEPAGMRAISEIFSQTLREDAEMSSSLWRIDTREALFQHVNSSPNRFTGACSYSVRVGGVLKALDGFVSLARQAIQGVQDDFPAWPAMIWGSLAWIFSQFYGRTVGHEYILTMLEDLTTATMLPFGLKTFLFQLFAELSVGLLKLALSLKKNPTGKLDVFISLLALRSVAYPATVPAKKSLKFQDFEAEHASKIRDARSGGAGLPISPSPAIGLVRQSSAMIPVPLNKLYDSLHAAEGCLAVVCLHGLPGIGKTQTTLQYCRTFDSEYFASIWIESDTRAKILNAFSRYAVRLKVEGASANAEQLRNAQLLISWLQTTDLPWLLVFDNVDEVRLLNDFWPSGGKGHVISTSRSPYMSEFCTSTSLHLDPLSRADSLGLFYNIIGDVFKDQHSQEIDDILDEWKGVPLALNHVGNFISRMHIDLKRFVKTYRRSTARILSTRYDMDAYPHSIATAFSVSELEGPARRLLQILCFLDPADISDELFLSSFDEERPFNSIETELEYYEILGSLCKSGLVTHDRGHITIHRLVQVVGFSDMGDDDHQNTFQEVLELVSRVFPRPRERLEDWERCDKNLPHVMFLCKRYRELFPEVRKNAKFASLLSACTWYMYERGLHAEAEPLVQLARVVCPDTPDAILTLADILWSLAGLYFEGNRITEALALVIRVFDIRKNKLDPLDQLLAVTSSVLGVCYLEDGQLDEALTSSLNALRIFESRHKSRVSDDDQMDWAYGGLTYTYWKLGAQGGTSSIRYGQRLWGLGLVRSAQKRQEESREAHKASLDIFLSGMPNSLKTGFGLHKMATFFHQEGNLEQALTYLENAHAIFERGLDPAPRVARTMFKMSEVLKDMGRMDEAAAKRMEAARLRSLIKDFPYDAGVTSEAYDTLVPLIWR